MDKLLECENCEYQSNDENKFEYKDSVWGGSLFCNECACCGECREIIRGLKL